MSNKVAVITGAGQGIGAATAEAFAAGGYDVAINYFHSKDAAEKLAKKCQGFGIKVLLVRADCTKETELQKLADKVGNEFGKVDVLVNNFGIKLEVAFESLTQASLIEALSGHLIPTILATSLFVPKLMRPQASVLNVSTIYGLDQSGSTGLPIFSAGKAAIINFTQTMAKIYAPNIRFNAVAPGFTKTPLWDTVDPERARACIDSTLQKEWVQPEDIAKALLFLAAAPHINAQTIVVDAGWSKR